MLSGDRYSVAISGILLLAADAFLPVPSSIVATTMGAYLGGAAGTGVNAVGLTLGCLAGFLAGRAGTPVSGTILGPSRQAAFEAWVRRNGLAALFLCRAVPILAETSMMALGAGRAPVGRIVGGAIAADVVLGAVYALAGAASGPQAAPAAPAIAAALLVPAAAALVVCRVTRRTKASPASATIPRSG